MKSHPTKTPFRRGCRRTGTGVRIAATPGKPRLFDRLTVPANDRSKIRAWQNLQWARF
jgi:hypothetical protein